MLSRRYSDVVYILDLSELLLDLALEVPDSRIRHCDAQ